MSKQKCVMVLNETLPAGVQANTSAVLAISLGQQNPEMVGYPLEDHSGEARNAITTVAIPILKSSAEQLSELREMVKQHEPELTVIDLISASRTTRNYDEYAEQLKETPTDELVYQGVALMGREKLIKRFTGNLPLLR